MPTRPRRARQREDMAYLERPWQWFHPQPRVAFDLPVTRWEVGLAKRSISLGSPVQCDQAHGALPSGDAYPVQPTSASP
jgi:hypothetical protein